MANYLRNPFGCFFAARYLPGTRDEEGEEEDTYERYFEDEPVFDAFCLDHHAPRPIPYHYAQVTFQITKRQRHAEWVFKTKFYETHYISLAYFGEEGLGLSIEDYIDVAAATPGKLPFKRTDKHPLFAPIHLKLSHTLSYRIHVCDICYYGRVTTPPVESLIGYNEYLLLSPPLLSMVEEETRIQEYDPLQWC